MRYEIGAGSLYETFGGEKRWEFEQEATERTEPESLLRFLGYLLLNCFVWKDFGFETPTSESVGDLERYEHVRGFTFSEHDHTETFRRY